MAFGDKKKIVLLESGERNRLIEQRADGKSIEYVPHPSAVWLYCSELQIVQSCSRPDADQPVQLQTTVQGKIHIQDDYGFSVIGDPSNKTKVLEVSFKELTTAKDIDLGEETLVLGRYGEASLLFLDGDWEIGSDASWWLGCSLDGSTFQALCSAVRAGNLKWLNVGIQLGELFSDEFEYAPMSIKRTLFLRPSKSDNDASRPQPARGYVTFLTMGQERVSLSKLRHQLDEEPEDLAEPSSIIQVKTPPLPTPPKAAVSLEPLRMTIKWVGGLIALALFLLVFK